MLQLISPNGHIDTAIHISIFYHESNFISPLRIINPFITHIFCLILIVLCYLAKLQTLPGAKTNKTSKCCPSDSWLWFYTPSSTMFFYILNGCHFPNVLYIWKLLKYLTLSGEMRLNTLARLLLLRLIYMLLRSSSNFQLYTPKPHLEIYRNTFVFSGSSVWNSLPSYIHNPN